MPSCLAICYELPPKISAGAIQTGHLLLALRDRWNIQAVTAVEKGNLGPSIGVHSVQNPCPWWLLHTLARLKLTKLMHWLIWPDEGIFWMIPALFKARAILHQHQPSVIFTAMMPYSAGWIGVILKWWTKTPLIFYFSDSLSCTDMLPSFPSWFHYKLARWLEDFYVRQCDRVIYVSHHNAEQVKQRHPPEQHAKFCVIRRGANPLEFAPSSSTTPLLEPRFRIVYMGLMGGWHSLYQQHPLQSKLLEAWNNLGRYQLLALDHTSHSPLYIGRAVQHLIHRYPEWAGKIGIELYGTKICSDQHIEQTLRHYQLEHLVTVHNALAREGVSRETQRADLLFQCLPARMDGSSGGRISAKTYEYLMSDRPILAALPRGENWDYYADKPGVWLVEPKDVHGMAAAIAPLVRAKFAGKPIQIDRSHLRQALSYEQRAHELEQVFAPFVAVQTP